MEKSPFHVEIEHGTCSCNVCHARNYISSVPADFGRQVDRMWRVQGGSPTIALCDDCLRRLQHMCSNALRPPIGDPDDPECTPWIPMTTGTRFTAVLETDPDAAPERYEVWGIDMAMGLIVLVGLDRNELHPVRSDWFITRKITLDVNPFE